MPENISPEEKLFKIIQNGKAAAAPQKDEAADSAKAKPKRMPKLNQNSIKRFFEKLQLKGLPMPEPREALALPAKLQDADLGAINKILALVLVLVATFAGYQLIVKQYDINALVEKASRMPVPKAKREAIEPFKPLSFYLDAVKKRDILSPAPKPEEKKSALEKEEPPKPKLAELAAGLTLQGISWGAVPKAIIKSEDDEQIFFLKEGQLIGATTIKVKSITKDKVMISHGEEEMELL